MNRERTAWGVILIIVGVIFLGERLGWGATWHIGTLWPLILVALGVIQLTAGRVGGAVWLLFLGGIFLLSQNHILGIRHSWPLFIVAAGIGMLVGRTERPRRHDDENSVQAAGGDTHD